LQQSEGAHFENTAQMERASDFKRHDGIWIYSSNLNSPEFEPIERKWVLYWLCRARFIKTKNYLKELKPFTTLPIKEVDQQQLIWLNYTNFVKEGQI
jgi:peptidyl-dipeptidase Dcp